MNWMCLFSFFRLLKISNGCWVERERERERERDGVITEMREKWWLIMNWIGVDSFILSLVLMAKVEEFIPYSTVVIVSMLLLFVVTKHISHLWCLKSLTQELVRMYSMILKLKLLMTMISRGNTDRWWPWWWRFEDIWACSLMENRIDRWWFKN